MEKEVRLIDADKLKQHYAWWENGTAEMTLAEAKRNFDVIIDVQPTVDAERHGHWVYIGGNIYECSVCGKGFADDDNILTGQHEYCGVCGARMDEDAKEE